MQPQNQLLENVIVTLNSWQSRHIKIDESITRDGPTFTHDRHFATFSAMILTLERVAVAFSGRRLMIHGKDPDTVYEIAIDALTSATISENDLCIIETLSPQIQRKSRLSVSRSL